MNILIDATTTQDQFATRGIGRVTKELVTALVEQSNRLKRNDIYYLLLFNAPTSLHAVVQQYPSLIRTINIGKMRYAGKLDFLWWRLQYMPAIRREMKQSGIDLFLTTNILRGFPPKGVPSIGVVHDFAFHYMKRFSLGPRVFDWIRRMQFNYAYNQLKHATGIVTISENTRKDLLTFVSGISPERVRTIHLGLSHDFECKNPDSKILETYLPKRIIDQGYLLYYGGLEVNKNVPALVRSYAEYRKLWEKTYGNTHICPFLVLAGGDFTKHDLGNPILAEIRDIITEEKLDEDVIFTGYYKDEHAGDLLSAARVFVHLSLYEGFGFSPLEAMKCGVPVVASNRSCYPETLGEGALLVDPTNHEAVAEACLSVTTDPEVSEKLADAGRKKASTYSWKNTAKGFYSFFEERIQAKALEKTSKRKSASKA